MTIKHALVIPDCLPTSTEVLTRTGWKKLNEVAIGEDVVTSTLDRRLRFAPVKDLVPVHEDIVYSYNRKSVSILSTGNHRNLLVHSDGRGYVKTTNEVKDNVSVAIASNGVLEDTEDSLIYDSYMTKIVGFCLGDGTRDADNWKISVSKDRKIKYLDSLFDDRYMTRNINGEYTIYRLRADLTREVDTFLSKRKVINWQKFLSLSHKDMQHVLDGIIESDGIRKKDRDNISFQTVREDHVELWQTLSHLTGKNCVRMKPQDNSHSTYPSNLPLYGACQSSNKTGSYSGSFDPNYEEVMEVSCISVDSGLFLARQGNNIFITGNCHIPAHDERAYNLMLDVASDLPRIDEVVVLGDYADFYGVSSWDKSPEVGTKLIDEVNEVNEKLDELDTMFKDAKRVFLEGNHENRLTRYISARAPELFKFVNTESLFRLKERGWHYVPYGPKQLHRICNSKLYCRHAPIGGNMHAAHNSVVKAGCSLIMGDNHRIQESQVVTINGDNHRGITTGWLGDPNNPVMGYVKNHHQWAHGFSVVTIMPDGTFFNSLIHIVDYKCYFNGTVYEG
jgi:hypothetical protein